MPAEQPTEDELEAILGDAVRELNDKIPPSPPSPGARIGADELHREALRKTVERTIHDLLRGLGFQGIVVGATTNGARLDVKARADYPAGGDE